VAFSRYAYSQSLMRRVSLCYNGQHEDLQVL
jgi:hypothetical protein